MNKSKIFHHPILQPTLYQFPKMKHSKPCKDNPRIPRRAK